MQNDVHPHAYGPGRDFEQELLHSAFNASGRAAIGGATDSQFQMEPPMAETADDRLRLLIERIERLEEEKKGIADDIRDV
jgi:hypothetical protein